MNYLKYFILILIFMVCVTSYQLSFAWTRPLFEDEEIVERSELIVVGHLKPDSIQYVLHSTKPEEGRSWEHHAILEISEILKGSSKDKEIPIIIHYGLDPIIGGYEERNGFMINIRGDRKDYPKDSIEIIDTGGHGGRIPLIKDAREDNIWLLRRLSGIYGRDPGTGNLGIVDPQDLQPIELKQYFLAYLSDNPEAVIKKSFKDNGLVSGRVQRYLDHKGIERILMIPDKSKRVEALLPYLLRRAHWGFKNEAEQGIIDCGVAAGKYLRDAFEDPRYSALRYDILRMMGEIGDKENIPIFIAILEKDYDFWATQKLENGWWNNNIESELTKKRRDIYGEVYMSVYALDKLDASEALEIIKKTKEQWKAIGFDNPQIVEECSKFLKKY